MVMSSAQCLKLHFTELHGMVTGPVRLDEGWSYKRKQLNPSLTTITGSAVALHCCKAHSTRNPAIAEGPRDAGVPVEIW